MPFIQLIRLTKDNLTVFYAAFEREARGLDSQINLWKFKIVLSF